MNKVMMTDRSIVVRANFHPSPKTESLKHRTDRIDCCCRMWKLAGTNERDLQARNIDKEPSGVEVD